MFWGGVGVGVEVGWGCRRLQVQDLQAGARQAGEQGRGGGGGGAVADSRAAKQQSLRRRRRLAGTAEAGSTMSWPRLAVPGMLGSAAHSTRIPC